MGCWMWVWNIIFYWIVSHVCILHHAPQYLQANIVDLSTSCTLISASYCSWSLCKDVCTKLSWLWSPDNASESKYANKMKWQKGIPWFVHYHKSSIIPMSNTIKYWVNCSWSISTWKFGGKTPINVGVNVSHVLTLKYTYFVNGGFYKSNYILSILKYPSEYLKIKDKLQVDLLQDSICIWIQISQIFLVLSEIEVLQYVTITIIWNMY